MLLMAFVGFTIAGAVSAAPNTAPTPFAPQPIWQWKMFDQGTKNYQNNWRDPWDDQKLVYKTYKWRYGWKNSNNHVKIYMQLFTKARTSPAKLWRHNPRESWRSYHRTSWRWVVNNSTVLSLDKQNRFQLNINKLTYNATGNLTGNTTTTVSTRFDAVRYYWMYKNRKDWRNPTVTPLISR